MTDIGPIPFLAQFRNAVLNGDKTMTARTKKYGNPGDMFTAFGAMFKLISVTEVCLSFVAHVCAKFEGLGSAEEFINVWKEIHPKKGYDPDQLVYLHEFKRVL